MRAEQGFKAYANACRFRIQAFRWAEKASLPRQCRSRSGAAGRPRPGTVFGAWFKVRLLTEVANRGIPLPEASKSLHKSMIQAASYYNDAKRQAGGAARLVI